MKAIELRVELPPDNRTSLERKDLRALASALDGYAKVTPLQRTRIREVDGGGPTGGLELIGIVVLMAPSALASVYRIVGKYLERHKGRQVIAQQGNKKLIIKGHGPSEEQAIIQEFFTGPSKRSLPQRDKRPRT